MARQSSSTLIPNTLAPSDTPAFNAFGLPTNSPASQALAHYQNASQGIIDSARRQAAQGFTQNHPILSGVLSGLAGAAIAGPVGAIAGPMLTQYGNKSRKSAIYNAAQDQLENLTTNYDKIYSPLAALSQGNSNLKNLLPLYGREQQNAADSGRGNSYFGAVFPKFENGSTQESQNNASLPSPMDYSLIDGGGELPGFSEPSGRALQANATSTQMPQMVSYQPKDVDYSGLDNVYLTPEEANSVLRDIASLRNNGMTEGRQQMLAPSQEAQNYGAANASNAKAYYDTEQGKYVAPKAQAWIRNEDAGARYKRSLADKTDTERRYIPSLRQAQISNYYKKQAGGQPSEASLKLMLANAIKQGDQKTVDSLTQALSVGNTFGGYPFPGGNSSSNNPSPASLRPPPSAAIEALRQNPTAEYIKFFNAKYGDGAANRYLK